MRFSNSFRLALIVLGLALSCGISSAKDIYIAQSAAGSNSGADCADAHAVTFFNTAGNWGTGAAQIGPGTTVHLCGTIATALVAQASGSGGNIITIFFEPSANISMPACPSTGCIQLDNRSFITVDGNNLAGTIRGTDNGSPASSCSGSQFGTHATGSLAVSGQPGHDLEVKNLNISNIYIHVCTSDLTINGPPGPGCTRFTSAYNITIDGNIMHDAAWCTGVSGPIGGTTTLNVKVYNNQFSNYDHGFALGQGSDSAENWNGIYIYGNHFGTTAAWDTTDNQFHHDGIHMWAYCSNGTTICPTTKNDSIYIYNNVFDGSWGTHNTGFVFFEGVETNAWLFNNVGIVSSPGLANGLFNAQCYSNCALYNNTAIGYGTSDTTGMQVTGTYTVKNNVFTNSAAMLGTGGQYPSGTPVTYTFANNVYAAGSGTNTFVYCPGVGGACSFIPWANFSTWVSKSGETGGQQLASAGLNADGSVQPGSGVIGAGTNLTSLCTGNLAALCADITGSPRPATGAWTAGAYNNSGSVAPPAPPSMLSAVVK